MHNASVVMWGASTLGLRTCAPCHNLLPIPSRLNFSRDVWDAGCLGTRRRSFSALSWVGHRTQKPPPRRLSYGDLIQYGGEAGRASPRRTLASVTSSFPTGLATGVRWQSTIPDKPSPRNKSKDPVVQIPYLSRKKVVKLFGSRVTVETSNDVLRKLQEQRESGTLDEGIKATGFDEASVARALSWLRDTYPLDEDAAILKRIEEEEKQAEAYKPQQHVDPNNIYGKSAFDTIRERNIKAREEKEALKKETEKALNADSSHPNAALVEQPGKRGVLARRSESAEWVKRYKEQAQIALEFAPLNSKEKFWRLLPPVAFCGAVVCFCVLLAQNYEPPMRKARLFPDVPPAAATILALISANALFFVMWRIPPMWGFMNNFFLLIAGKPRAWSLIGNVFSHQDSLHLLTNICVLWCVGTRLHDDIGRGNFLAIYFSTGVLSSLASLSWFVLGNKLTFTSLGASGALAGIIAAWCCIHSGETLFEFRFIPEIVSLAWNVDAIIITVIIIEIFAMLRGGHLIDHRAHFGGFATGYAAALAMKHRAKRRQELDVDRLMKPKLGIPVKESLPTTG